MEVQSENVTQYPDLGVEVRRSNLNTPQRKRSRIGHRVRIVEAGEGLFATRHFRKHEHILDYRFKNGIRRPGDEVDWLTRDELHARYPPLTNMPDGAGTHVLKPNGHPWYYDTALSGGVGGKANTRIGNQTATWRGSHIIAGPKGLMPGEEIFVPYTHGSSYILTTDDIDDRREHWYYVAKDRKITIGVPTPRISSTPAPPRGGEGGNHHAGARVFQHVAGVSAPT